uniref:Reverse transcriptase domain-containing protein n=1 Tax=Glossina brevipalpis TaxID=37001 RepID=A0A1A9WBD0_9MUSC
METTSDLTECNVAQMETQLTLDVSIKLKPYRIPLARRATKNNLCVDYRSLNRATVKSTTSTPSLQEQVRSFILLDLRSLYWTVHTTYAILLESFHLSDSHP